ncbi:MAG: hypothetical protein QM756_47385 [Polyangiaceae bacterium]
MGDEKRDSEAAGQAPTTPSSPPRISRPVFAPPRPSGGSSPAPRPTTPPSLTPSAPPTLPSNRPPAPSERARAAADALGTPLPPPSARPVTMELEAKLVRSARELSEARTALSRSEAERKRLDSALGDQAARHAAELQASRRELEQRQGELERRAAQQRELEARVDELEAQALEVVSLRLRNTELEALLAAQPKAAPAVVVADDLKRLRGVGPAFERALHGLGITTFAQIAGFTEEDVERVARALKLKPERIRRDDWVGAARAFSVGAETG